MKRIKTNATIIPTRVAPAFGEVVKCEAEISGGIRLIGTCDGD